MRRVAIAIALLAALLCSPFNQVLSAQSTSSAIAGIVRDASGAAVPECDVILISIDTGQTLLSQTDRAGAFSFPSVQPGTYSLTFAKPGFKTYALNDFRVTASQRVTQDVLLEVGAVSEEVTVSANGASPLLEPTSNELGTLIDREAVQQLPLNGRSFLQLGMLSGAVQDSGTLASDFLTLQVGHADRAIIVTGHEQDMTGYLVNGMSTAGTRLGHSSLNLSVAAVDQFKIHEGFFLPSEGPNTAGVISVVTKSGTNQFHGELFEFKRNSRLDARNFFDGARTAPFRRDQFGGAAGGPILRNRVFVFGHYEGRRQVLDDTVKATVPSARMFAGDFSELLALPTPIRIYDPASYDPVTRTRQAFPGNVIPASRLNPMASSLLKYYKSAPNYAPENLVGNPRTTDNYDQFGARVDVSLSPRHALYAQYAQENSPTVYNGLFPLSGYSYPLNTKMGMAQLTSTLSPRLVNEFRVGFIRPEVFYAGEAQAGIQNEIGFTGTADVNGVPGIFLDGFNQSGNSSNASFGRNQGLIGNIDHQFQVHERVHYLRGQHEFSVGTDLRYVRTLQESSNFYSRGGVFFSSIFSAQLAPDASGRLAPVAGTGSAFADFLLGMPKSGTVTSMPQTHFRWTEVAPYVQDTWRVRSDLTLNLGLAWNLATPPNPAGEDRNLAHAFNFETGQVEYAALGQVKPSIYNMDLNNLAPRVGVAWQPRGSDKTVIRGGAGIYYPAVNALYNLFAITAPGVAIVQSLTNDPSLPQPTYQLGVNTFPRIVQTPLTAEYAKNASGAIFALDKNWRTPYVQQWSLAYQRTLTPSTLIEFDYIGSRSLNLPIRTNADDCSVPESLACVQSAKPYPQFSYIYLASSTGRGKYDAFVAKFQRQFKDGFSFVTNYTWSKSMSNTMQGGAPVGLNQRGVCPECDYGLTGYNVPQRLVVSSVWELPLGKGRRFLNGRLSPFWEGAVSGWMINAIGTFSKGNPFTVLAAASTSMDPLTNFRPNRVCDGRSTLANTDLRSNGRYWFDPSCFQTPAPNYFGNSGTNIITGPGVNNWDVAVVKAVGLPGGTNIQLRGELFNAFNHTQFQNPSATMTDTNFGRITTARSARKVQLGVKVLW